MGPYSRARVARAITPTTALVAILASTLALSGSASRPKDLPTIVYIGAFTRTTDPSFARLSQALLDRHGELLRTHRLTYAHASDVDQSEASDAIRRVFEGMPRVVVAPTADSARLTKPLRGRTPVVFASFQEPVATGIVSSAGARSERVTGVSLADVAHEKRLEILRQAFPQSRRLAVLADRSWVSAVGYDSTIRSLGRKFGWTVSVVVADTLAELDAATTATAASGHDAWYVPATYLAYRHEARIIERLAALRQPAIHATVGEVHAGALMAYAQDTGFAFDALADLVARVCNGEDPGQIPIEVPRRFVLAVRPRADPGGPHLPPALVRRADLVY